MIRGARQRLSYSYRLSTPLVACALPIAQSILLSAGRRYADVLRQYMGPQAPVIFRTYRGVVTPSNADAVADLCSFLRSRLPKPSRHSRC